MNEQIITQIILPLISGIFGGGVMAAIINNLFRKPLTNAEVGKLSAETKKILAEAEIVRIQQ